MRKTVIDTPLGKLIPFYEITDGRQKNRPSVEYYKSGALYSVYLQEQTVVKTPAGDMPAELITFYESGAVKRVFPLYGQLSGFWTEDQEYGLATVLPFMVQGKRVLVKPLCVHFYESGKIASITIWPKERMKISTRYGEITTDLGVEFYESGEVKSIEPILGSKIIVPLSEKNTVMAGLVSSDGKPDWNDGVLYPFYSLAFRMHADDNSLKFDLRGRIIEIKTVPLFRKYNKKLNRTSA